MVTTEPSGFPSRCLLAPANHYFLALLYNDTEAMLFGFSSWKWGESWRYNWSVDFTTAMSEGPPE
ncbi:MAG TPA: hypothetical protein VF772_23585 [Terriglobales bacterium]